MSFELSEEVPWKLISDTSADEFVKEMLKLGKLEEISLVAVTDNEGRGSKLDIDLPLHRDGDYSAKVAERNGQTFDKNVDIVGLYCVKEGTSKTFVQVDDEALRKFVLKNNQALVFDNKRCLHGREGKVGDRILLRIWISTGE